MTPLYIIGFILAYLLIGLGVAVAARRWLDITADEASPAAIIALWPPLVVICVVLGGVCAVCWFRPLDRLVDRLAGRKK